MGSRLDRVIAGTISGRTFSLTCAADVPNNAHSTGLESYHTRWHHKRWLDHSCSLCKLLRHVRLAHAVLSNASYLRTSKQVWSSRGHGQRSKCASVHSLRCESSIDQLQIKVDSGPKEYFLKVCETVTPSARSYLVRRYVFPTQGMQEPERRRSFFCSFCLSPFAAISHNQVTLFRV